MSYTIVTDACCDLPASYVTGRKDFVVIPMSYQVDGEICELNPLNPSFEQSTHEFYEKLNNGANATTFQINQLGWQEALTPLLEEGKDVLAIVFSSGLSGTYLASQAAVQTLQKKYPERKIASVDSLSASMGQGLLVHYALQKRDEGLDFEQNVQWIKDNAQNTIHWFTVNDLHFLHRGGRVSAASAYFGSMLKIKPVLNVNWEGKLIPREKVQGRKRALRALLEKAQEFAIEPDKQMMFLSHGDCLEDAQWLAEKVKEELHVPEILISQIGPIIGCHSGPGTVALFFMSKGR